MRRIALLAVAVALAGCQTTGEGVGSFRSGLYDGGRAVLYQARPAAASAEQAMQMATAAYAAGDSDQALYQFLRASELDPERHEALIWVGRIHRERGNSQLAELALQEVLTAEPDNLEALTEFGTLQIAQRQYPQAQQTLGSALHRDQQRLAGVVPDASAEGEALRVDGQSPLRIYSGLGVLADLRSEFAQAQAFYRLALQVSPRSAMVANSMGYSHYLAGDWGAAQAAYRQALNFDSRYKPAWRNYGMLLARMGRYEEALSAFEQVESRAEASNDVGYVCLIDGRLEQAELFFRSAIEQSPAHYEVAWQNLRRVQQIRSIRGQSGAVGEARAPAMTQEPVVSSVSLPAPLEVLQP